METISADIVWGLAMRAQTTNNGYVKTAVIDESTNQVITTPNHVLVKSWLQSNQVPTQLEIDQGNECRLYIKGFIFKQLDDTITDFECTALKVADIDWFKTHMDVGATYHLRSRIKTKRSNGTTQLNFVALA